MTLVPSLHFAAAEGLSEVCEQLVKSGEDVNMRDDLGWTALMHAVRNGHSDLADRLLFYGADACLCNRHGVTAFTLAALRCEEMLGVLYNSLNPELRQEEANNMLQVACARGLHNAAKWVLFNTSAQVNHVSQTTGMTPLHLAIIGHHYKLVEMLLSFGAEVVHLTALGEDGFTLAEINNDKKMLYLLGYDNSPKKTGCFEFKKCEKPEFETIDPNFTENKIFLDINGDIVLKNSPNRPVFKTRKKLLHLDFKVDKEMKLLESPSLRSVFLSPRHLQPSPQLTDSKDNGNDYFDTSVDDKTNLLGVASVKSEFCPTPENCSTPVSKTCGYSLNGLISPRHRPQLSTSETPVQTPKRGKKRKLQAVCTSWLKRFTKRRTQSLEDLGGHIDFDALRNNGLDFSHLLFGLGLEEFYPIFKEQELDMWTFLTLTAADLDAMGIQDQSSQEQILTGVGTLRKAQL